MAVILLLKLMFAPAAEDAVVAKVTELPSVTAPVNVWLPDVVTSPLSVIPEPVTARAPDVTPLRLTAPVAEVTVSALVVDERLELAVMAPLELFSVRGLGNVGALDVLYVIAPLPESLPTVIELKLPATR